MGNKIKTPVYVSIEFVLWIYLIVSVPVSIHRYFLGEDHYGNYLIFKNSFYHLLSDSDLYKLYPELNLDLFKYSPTFAVLFSPFSILPDYIGLILWSLLNAILLFFAVRSINIEEKKKVFILWFILIELITSLQNCQSNALTASLVIFTFSLLEKRKYLIAGVCVAAGFYIKLFGVLGAVFWFMYPGRAKFFTATLGSLIILFVSPLIFVSPDELTAIYKSWLGMLSTDASHNLNHSVMSILKNWFGVEVNKTGIQLIGIVLLFIPLVRRRFFQEKYFRLLFLCSILIWSVIFNHKAESATYIIAVVGCAVWFFSSERKNLDIFLIALLFLLTCLSPTDLFPKYLRDNFIVPYSLKALPCILIWIKIQFELLLFHERTETAN